MLVRQVKFAFDLLEFFAQRRAPATLTEISDHFGWPRSSTFNLIETLSMSGYLHELRQRGGYYPTRRLLKLAEALSAAEPVPGHLSEAVRSLADLTGETTILGSVAGINAIYLDVVETQQSIRYFAKPGDLVPLYPTAIGRALLSLMCQDEVEDIIARTELVRHAENSPRSWDDVRELIDRIRLSGHSINNNGYQPHLLGVAVPFEIDHRRFAILVAGPSSRMAGHEEKIVKTIISEVDALSRSLEQQR